MAIIKIEDLPQDEVINEQELRKVFGGKLAYAASSTSLAPLQSVSLRTKRQALPIGGLVRAGFEGTDCWTHVAGSGGLDRIGLFGR